MPGPLNDIIMRLMAQGGKRGLPMVPSPELLQYLQASKSGISNPVDAGPVDMSNILDPTGIVGAQQPPPISQDPWFDETFQALLDALGSRYADEARLPPTRFQQESPGEFTDEGLRPEDVMTPAGMPRPATGPSTGNYYIWAKNSNGKSIRVDGPFESEIAAARELRLMQRTDPDVVRSLQAFVAPEEGV